MVRTVGYELRGRKAAEHWKKQLRDEKTAQRIAEAADTQPMETSKIIKPMSLAYALHRTGIVDVVRIRGKKK